MTSKRQQARDKSIELDAERQRLFDESLLTACRLRHAGDTLRKIGAQLGVGQERARQLLAVADRRLRVYGRIALPHLASTTERDDWLVDHMEKFWGLIDEIMNSVLFLLIGMEVILIPLEKTVLVEAALIAIPMVLLARLISVSIPIFILKARRRFSPGVIFILTWSGLRGGISVALVLSLKGKLSGDVYDVLVLATYFVVLFSVIVQGLTVKRLLRRYLRDS